MGLESITDKKIQDLLSIGKQITNPYAKNKTKGKHVEKDYKVIDNDTGKLSFTLFTRQNSLIENDFSAGLVWHMPSGENLTLCRYNGSSHSHPNFLEGTKTGYNCHKHVATERYIIANKKPEGFAETSTQYTTLQGAIHCLLLDCNIHGMQTTPDDPRLI